MTEVIRRPQIEDDPEFKDVINATPSAAKLGGDSYVPEGATAIKIDRPEPEGGNFELNVGAVMSRLANERLESRRAELEYDPRIRVREWDESFEREQREAIKADIGNRIGSDIFLFMARLETAGRLKEGIATKFNLKNKKLLELLRDNGYITPEMAEAGEADISGVVAGQLLTSKSVSPVNKHVLVGPLRDQAKEVIDENVKFYLDKDIPE